MQRHTDPQRSDALGPPLLHNASLGIKGRSDRIRSGREGGLHRITDHLEEHAVVRLDGSAQEGQVAFDRRRHRRLVPLPQRGAPLDVGEEEGDGAGGEIGHSHP